MYSVSFFESHWADRSHRFSLLKILDLVVDSASKDGLYHRSGGWSRIGVICRCNILLSGGYVVGQWLRRRCRKENIETNTISSATGGKEVLSNYYANLLFIPWYLHQLFWRSSFFVFFLGFVSHCFLWPSVRLHWSYCMHEFGIYWYTIKNLCRREVRE